MPVALRLGNVGIGDRTGKLDLTRIMIDVLLLPDMSGEPGEGPKKTPDRTTGLIIVWPSGGKAARAGRSAA